MINRAPWDCLLFTIDRLFLSFLIFDHISLPPPPTLLPAPPCLLHIIWCNPWPSFSIHIPLHLQTCLFGVYIPHVQTVALIKLAQLYSWNTDVTSFCAKLLYVKNFTKFRHKFSVNSIFTGWWCRNHPWLKCHCLGNMLFCVLFTECCFCQWDPYGGKMNIAHLSSQGMVINLVLSA